MKKKYKNWDKVAMILLIIGGLNWGLGLFDINLVTLLFGMGSVFTKIVYGLVGISAIYKGLELLK